MSNFNHKTIFYFLNKLIHMYTTVKSNLNLERLSILSIFYFSGQKGTSLHFLKTL